MKDLKFLKKNNFINKEWNALNFLPQNASTVGLIDLNILSREDEKRNNFFEKLTNNKFKLLYLLGSDNLDFKKIMNLLYIKEAMVIEELRSLI